MNSKEVIFYKKALLEVKNSLERKKLQEYIDKIEYSEYDDDIIASMRIYKEKVREYAKFQLLNPNEELNLNKYINIEKPKISEKYKILYGTVEIANQMNTYANEMKKMGYQAFTLDYYPSYLKYGSDFNMNFRFTTREQFIDKVSYFISEFDIFHFFFNCTLIPDYSDLKVIKRLNKKIVMHNWGSDVRTYDKAVEMSKYYALLKNSYFKHINENETHRKLLEISKYADAACTFQLQEFIHMYYKKIYEVNLAIDLQKYSFVEKTNNKKLTIVHAPTNPAFKGTEYILDAIEKLKSKYDFEFILIKGMTHEAAKKIYTKADLIIDQIMAGGPGLFAHECMAMGKNVICYVSEYYFNKYNYYYGQNNSLISANPDNIYEKLEDFILNKEIYLKNRINGRKFVEQNNDSRKIALDLIKIYDELNKV